MVAGARAAFPVYGGAAFIESFAVFQGGFAEWALFHTEQHLSVFVNVVRPSCRVGVVPFLNRHCFGL